MFLGFLNTIISIILYNKNSILIPRTRLTDNINKKLDSFFYKIELNTKDNLKILSSLNLRITFVIFFKII